jgi:hypothetical protein
MRRISLATPVSEHAWRESFTTIPFRQATGPAAFRPGAASLTVSAHSAECRCGNAAGHRAAPGGGRLPRAADLRVGAWLLPVGLRHGPERHDSGVHPRRPESTRAVARAPLESACRIEALARGATIRRITPIDRPAALPHLLSLPAIHCASAGCERALGLGGDADRQLTPIRGVALRMRLGLDDVAAVDEPDTLANDV